jgi:hypothetical protein
MDLVPTFERTSATLGTKSLHLPPFSSSLQGPQSDFGAFPKPHFTCCRSLAQRGFSSGLSTYNLLDEAPTVSPEVVAIFCHL